MRPFDMQSAFSSQNMSKNTTHDTTVYPKLNLEIELDLDYNIFGKRIQELKDLRVKRL